MARPRFWHRVRFKLLLVSVTLLGIPWAGYRFIQETEQFLREAQDTALRTTASSIANVMHGEADQFSGVARPGSVLTFRNLYLHDLDEPPQIDGYRDEWERFEDNLTFLQAPNHELQASLFLGQHERHLYLLIGIDDTTPTFGPDGDRVELAVTDSDGLLQRYLIRPRTPGWVTAERQLLGDESPETSATEPAIRGDWQPHTTGHTLELRIPRKLIQDRLSVRILDSASGQLLASGRMFPADALGRIVTRSAVLQTVLGPVTPTATRVWVTDHQGLVVAQSGQLDSDAPLSADQPNMPWFIRDLILAVLPRDADAVAELDSNRTHLFMAPVTDALSGRAANIRRQPPGGEAVVVSAAVPIRASNGIRGAVLVEQTTNAILSIQNLALQRLFGITLVFFAVTSLALLGFASLLASRITHLRDSVEGAVSHDGRIVGQLGVDGSRDEIGDLSRSFHSVLKRLNDYNHYLEEMASRLAHELRTPLAVVRSSLDNASQVDPGDRDVYLDRARDGAQRLEHILQRLREATGLEQAMRQTEAEHFDLAALLRLQTASLRSLYPDTEIELDGANQTVTLLGAPDLVGQALDKLVGNAMDFRRPGTAVRIGCRLDHHSVHLAVDNDGPPLPTDVDVFQSMTSGRQGRQQEPHLGLGLFIVRLIAEFHGGQATARNLPGGVSVEISLPR
jgi:two-component system sensor histidine kinase ChvG